MNRKPEGLPERWVSALFGKFVIHYGNLWSSTMGTQQQTDAAIIEWSKVLKDVSPEQIRNALDNLPPMPPTLPQFKALCLNTHSGLTHNTAAYKMFPKALPKPKASQDVVTKSLKKIRVRPKMTPEEMDAELAKLRARN